MFFIKFYILENNFVFPVSCINFKFPWRNCVFKIVDSSFYKSKTLCACVEDNIFQAWLGIYVNIRSFSRVKTSS